MSYMRYPHYIWSDGNIVYVDNVELSMADADAFAIMHVAKILRRGDLDQVARRVADNYRGNASADAINELLGLPTMTDEITAALEARGICPRCGLAWQPGHGIDPSYPCRRPT